MQYTFTNISLEEDKNGGKFVKTTACRAGDPNDRGFSLPFFNPEIIRSVQQCIAKGETPTFTLPAELEEVTVNCGAVYCRRIQNQGTDGKMIITDQPAKDPETGKPILYKKIRVHTIFQYAMHDAYYVEGERKGMRIMEDSFDVNGKPIKVPAKAFDLDDLGRPVRNYMRGWSPEERKDQILKTFFILADEQYQNQPVIATEQPQQGAQQTLENAAQNLFQPAPEAAPAAGGAAPAAGGAPQQGAAPQPDPLAQ